MRLIRVIFLERSFIYFARAFRIFMKKLISIFLLVIYSSTSFAVTMDIHYCCSNYSGISFSNFKDAVPGSCGHNESTNKSCCTGKVICAKTDNHKAVQQYWLNPDLSFTLAGYFVNEQVGYINPESIKTYYSSSGFTRSHSPSFLTFLCIYRI